MKKIFDYKAWVLDFDGTLFYQLPMRVFMAAWLVLYYFRARTVGRKFFCCLNIGGLGKNYLRLIRQILINFNLKI